ncbi:TIGR02594 family protein, partial [Prevotella histicola]|uniref:TIGR02594 family protein n=1 Tax=Prevotella histicola TaxID=470565 RepID=UPI00288048C0
LYWDEENQLMVLSDNGKTSRYTYNAAGERIMKSYGTMEGVYINGAPQGITFHETDNFTLYPASIISINKNRFTKHYFIGDKRVASRIGTGMFNNVYGRNGSYVTAGQQDYAERMNQIQTQKEAYYKKVGVAPGAPTEKGAYGDPENTGVGYNAVLTELGNHDVPQGWIQTPHPNTTPGTNPGPPVSWNDPSNPDDPQAGYGYIPNDTTKEETFFYHSDHLGSTSYITDDKANITQYDAYLPYGELLVDEHSSSEEMPHKFNGKQFDEETGLYYYGARYMNPVTSLFLGIDTKVELKPNYGGSLYCLQNPILLIDPDGNWERNSDGNLVAQHGDNAQTLAEFIGVTAKESLNILLANGVTINKKGILSLKEGQEIISNILTDVVCLGHAKAGNGNENKITDTGSANTPWMDIATSQIGVSEIPGNKSNPQIVAYHATTCRSTSDATPWCSSFVNWSLNEAGIRGTNSASSQSWLTWGKRISKPVYGCIAVLSYGGGHGHVAFVVGMNARGNIILLGGNQHDQVNLSPFKAKMTYVYPRGYTPSKEPLQVLPINGRTTSYRETR